MEKYISIHGEFQIFETDHDLKVRWKLESFGFWMIVAYALVYETSNGMQWQGNIQMNDRNINLYTNTLDEMKKYFIDYFLLSKLQ